MTSLHFQVTMQDHIFSSEHLHRIKAQLKAQGMEDVVSGSVGGSSSQTIGLSPSSSRDDNATSDDVVDTYKQCRRPSQVAIFLVVCKEACFVENSRAMGG